MWRVGTNSKRQKGMRDEMATHTYKKCNTYHGGIIHCERVSAGGCLRWLRRRCRRHSSCCGRSRPSTKIACRELLAAYARCTAAQQPERQAGRQTDRQADSRVGKAVPA